MIAISAVLGILPIVSSASDPRPVDLPFKDLKGQKVRLRDYRGKVVVLNFWATWCIPCREEMPLFVEMQQEYGSAGVEFIAASLDDSSTRPKISDFIAEFNLTFRVWTGASTMDLADLKLGQTIPATAFLDREGRIRARVLGPVSREELKKRLDELTVRVHGREVRPH